MSSPVNTEELEIVRESALCIVSSSVGVETEDSEEKLERSATVLVALRNNVALEAEKGDADEEDTTEQWLEHLPDIVTGQDPRLLCNRERLVTAWEVPMEGECVEGVEGRDWVYNYLKPLETGEYERLVPRGRKKVTQPGSRDAFIDVLCEENAITPGRALVKCKDAYVVRFPCPPATSWSIDAPRT